MGVGVGCRDLIDRFLMVDGLGRQARGLGLGGDIAGTVAARPARSVRRAPR
jgi:hypothetical protein